MIVLHRQVKRPVLKQRERVLLVLLAGWLRAWKQALLIVQPHTLLRWHRDLFRLFWRRRSKSEKKRGRPPLTDNIVDLIKRIERESLLGSKAYSQGAAQAEHQGQQKHDSEIHARGSRTSLIKPDLGHIPAQSRQPNVGL